jgi:hypothetical protein
MFCIKIYQINVGKTGYQTCRQIVKRGYIYLFYNFRNPNFVTHKHIEGVQCMDGVDDRDHHKMFCELLKRLSNL